MLKDLQTIKKILFIQQRQLGDVLLASHAIFALKKAFPHLQIDFLTEKKCETILQNNPYIDNFYFFDKKEQNNVFKQIAFYKERAKKPYDAVISMQNLPRCLLQVFFSQAKFKIGMHEKWYKNIFYTHTTKISSTYAGAKKLDILAPLGMQSYEQAHPQYFVTQEEKEEAKQVLENLGYDFSKKQLLISMDITHKDIKRRYPSSFYAQIIQSIQETFPDSFFFFLRAENEDEQVLSCFHEWKILTQKQAKHFLLPEKCPNIRLSAAIMSLCHYHIGNCSFPRHLAVALDIPSSTLVGSSDNSWAYPHEKHKTFSAHIDCQPCSKKQCTNKEKVHCLHSLKPETIIDTLIEHIKSFSRDKTDFKVEKKLDLIP